MDFSNIELNFNKYVSNFDIDDDKIKLKYIHTLKVVELCEEIARRLDLSNEEILLARLIGFLHDIGRFEQIKRYNTFKDIEMDHADFGVKLLFEENLIRDFIKDNKYDDIIYNAVKYHNKLKIKDGLDAKTNLFCKIIRDADKSDIFRVRTVEYTNNFIEPVNPVMIEKFDNNESLKFDDIKSKSDSIMILVGFINDFNFKESIQILKEKNLLTNFMNSIKVSKENESIFKHIKQKVEKFLEV